MVIATGSHYNGRKVDDTFKQLFLQLYKLTKNSSKGFKKGSHENQNILTYGRIANIRKQVSSNKKNQIGTLNLDKDQLSWCSSLLVWVGGCVGAGFCMIKDNIT